MNYFNILIIIAVVVVLWLVLTYNGLVRRRYRVREAWSDIDVQLKRRYDLIPNLIETVKGYAAHEKEAFEKVTQARAAALGAQTVHDKEAAENTLSSALKSIFAIAEAYPQLRAVESFTKLQEELADTENKIQAARRFYNGNVMELNTKIETFPTNLIAGIFSFKKEEFFQLQQEEAKEPVKVKF
ncbi:MAG: LemA family protein [Patescibacteria group bacterium]